MENEEIMNTVNEETAVNHYDDESEKTGLSTAAAMLIGVGITLGVGTLGVLAKKGVSKFKDWRKNRKATIVVNGEEDVAGNDQN